MQYLCRHHSLISSSIPAPTQLGTYAHSVALPCVQKIMEIGDALTPLATILSRISASRDTASY